MVLFGELKVRLFDGALVGASIDAQRFVKVSFRRTGKASGTAWHVARDIGGCQAVVASVKIYILYQRGSVPDGSAREKGPSAGRCDSAQPQSSHGSFGAMGLMLDIKWGKSRATKSARRRKRL